MEEEAEEVEEVEVVVEEVEEEVVEEEGVDHTRPRVVIAGLRLKPDSPLLDMKLRKDLH